MNHENQFFAIMVCLLMCTLGVNGQKKQAAGVNFEKNYAEALAKVGKANKNRVWFCILLSGR